MAARSSRSEQTTSTRDAKRGTVGTARVADKVTSRWSATTLHEGGFACARVDTKGDDVDTHLLLREVPQRGHVELRSVPL
eukprot:9503955-Pyramimonas_sp.AAC.1